MKYFLHTLIKNKKGVSALEYGLLAALIAGALVASITTLSGDIQTLFTTLGTTITANTPTTTR